MKRVVGIGGIFFKASDPEALSKWYQTHLGFKLEAWGGAIFKWADAGGAAGDGKTVWSLFPNDTKYFAPSTSPFMINYRVENLHALLDQLRAEGCTVDPKTDDSEFGKFGWVMDPEGNRVELWEAPPGK